MKPTRKFAQVEAEDVQMVGNHGVVVVVVVGGNLIDTCNKW